eukprot:GGOE01055343.1.p1 GENE.GGOE01055343.1~~GGOE01055343.1.p1  ORF type:complete len:511 (-),score=67.36 GGOE01055343.1:216-1520(-)
MTDHKANSCPKSLVVCSGCGKTMNKEQHKKHITKCSETVPCDLCGEPVRSAQLMDHLASACRKNMTSCNYCHQRMEREQLMTSHPADCAEWPTACEFCKEEVKRTAMKAHLTACPSVPEGTPQCEPTAQRPPIALQSNGQQPVTIAKPPLSPLPPSAIGTAVTGQPSTASASPSCLKPKDQSPTRLTSTEATPTATSPLGTGLLLQPDGVSCPFAPIGCPMAALGEQLPDHLETEQPHHLGLLLQEVLRLREENANLQRLQVETNGVILVMQRTIDVLEERLEALEHGDERLRAVKVAGSPSVSLRHSPVIDFASTSPLLERPGKVSQEQDDDGRLECPSCGRKFCEESFQRHVPICQGKPKLTGSHRKSLPDALQAPQSTTSPSKPFIKRGSLTPLRSSQPNSVSSSMDLKRCPKCATACETKYCTKCGCPML